MKVLFGRELLVARLLVRRVRRDGPLLGDRLLLLRVKQVPGVLQPVSPLLVAVRKVGEYCASLVDSRRGGA